jgi:hypothetical protein
MPWVRLDDEFAEHPKVLSLSYRGRWMHIAALCYSNRMLTDGFIPRPMVASLCPHEETDPIDEGPAQLARSLCALGLWDVAERNGLVGYQIHDFAIYQPSKRDVLAARKQVRLARSLAGKSSATKRATKREQSGQHDVQQMGNPVPDPVPLEEPPVSPSRGGQTKKAKRAAKRAGVHGPTWLDDCDHEPVCGSENVCIMRHRCTEDCPHSEPKCTWPSDCSKRLAVAS